jgi:hypothetical protein
MSNLTVGELRDFLKDIDSATPVLVCGLDGDGCSDADRASLTQVVPVHAMTCQYRTPQECEQYKSRVIGEPFNAVYIG